ncbi:hypothetical protein ACQZ4Y_19865 [Rhizobium sp. L80/93]
MKSRKNASKERLNAERKHFTSSTKRLYVKQSPWSRRRGPRFDIPIGVIENVDSQIKVLDVEFSSTILAQYDNLDAMLADWVKL